MLCLGLKAQGTPPILLVNLTVNNTPIITVFNMLRDQTGYYFTYSNDLLNERKLVSFRVFNYKLELLLDKILEGTDCTWQIKGKSIVITNASKEDPKIYLDNDSLIIISGKIIDENGNPIPGATLSVKNSKQGSITNEKGEFLIKDVVPRSKILITSIGYASQEITVDSKWKSRSFILKNNVNVLDEMIVSTYLPTSKRYSLGGISTIASKQIENKPVTNPLLALQAEVPGIVINQNSGLANSGITVQIRGQNSFRNGTDPLYVIDGVPYPSQMLPMINTANGKSGNLISSATTGNPLSFINPNDIESISVLKDADATSIYGSRAAAGAILITTKRGHIGLGRLNVNFQLGAGKISRFLDVMNNKQYLGMRHIAKANDLKDIFPSDYDLNGTWDTTRSVNWQKELLGGTANFSHIQSSVSGGTENLQFLIGLGYHKETTVYRTNLGDQKGSVHFNINNISNNKRLRIQFTGNYMADENRLPNSDGVSDALYLPPVAPQLFKPDGTLNWGTNADSVSTFQNPLATFNQKAKIKTTNLISILGIQYEVLTGLDFKANFGYTSMLLDEYQTFPLSAYPPEYRKYLTRRASYGNGYSNTWIAEPQVSYKTNIGKSLIEGLIGASFQEKQEGKVNLSADQFSSDLLLEDPRSAGTLTTISTLDTKYKYNAIFGLLNFRLMDKYIFHLSMRRDGSSRFGPENLFHNFGSIGGGWIFSSEPWIRNHVTYLSYGKISVSYGTSGNDQIGDYQYINNFSSNSVPIPYQGIVGLGTDGIPNPYLQWEETKKMQIGIDLGFLNDNILISANYYRNRSSNQLLSYKLPTITGGPSYTRNLPATIQNSGLEFNINTKNIKTSNFTWTSNGNFTIARNKLISFPGLSTSPYASTYEIGKPMTGVKLYKYHGVDSQTGLYDFYDSQGKIVTNPGANDLTVMLDFTPTFYAGFGNSLSYKNLHLDVLFQASRQVVSNISAGKFPGFFGDNLGNQPVSVLDGFWKYPGDVASIQKFSTRIIRSAINSSDFSYSNVWFLRLKNASLSWKLPNMWTSKAKIKDISLSINCQNVFTITNYHGLDPESGSTAFPPLRVIMLGINANL